MGNNPSTSDDTLMNLHVHNCTMVVYIQYKFHEIPSIGYLVMVNVILVRTAKNNYFHLCTNY